MVGQFESALFAGFSLLGSAGAVVLDADTTAFVKPVTGAVITQPFGCTSFALEAADPNCTGGHFHSGIDLAVAAGTPVYATLAGIAQVIDDTTGYGLHIVIDHGQRRSSLYGHLDSVCVTTGARVAAGQVIGQVGSTGDSTGPHLHFEIRTNGTPRTPSSSSNCRDTTGLRNNSSHLSGGIDMVNRVILIGNLTKDAESLPSSGKPMTRLRLATKGRVGGSTGGACSTKGRSGQSLYKDRFTSGLNLLAGHPRGYWGG